METYLGPRKPCLWPDNARICVSVTIAFEAFVNHGHYGAGMGKAGKKNHYSLSFAEYGPKVGVWRIFDVLERNAVKATFDVGGLAAERHPHVLAAMRARGHEAAGHGWANDIRVDDDDPQAERKEIRDTIAAIEKGYGERPVGWVSQGSFGSANTLQVMADEGFLWNGDDASDDVPFLRDVGGKKLVILPRVNFPTNDLIVWQKPGNPPAAYFDSFKESFDFLYGEGVAGNPKWVDLLLHSDLGGRPTLIGTFERCLHYAGQHSGVWFARRRDLAEWTMKSEGK